MSLPVLVVMGVSGSGKSTVAKPLAERLGWPFQEGDDLHPAANVAKMKAGVPLDDADRAPWLDAIRDWIAERLRADGGGVVTCSALRHAYRDRLRRAGEGVTFIYLDGSKAVIGERIAQRHGHFMPPALLDSQFATLEEPTPDEHAIVVDIDQPADRQVDEIIAAVAT
jgi:carbohydrate kinase (thermoresistant glucokinase family)